MISKDPIRCKSMASVKKQVPVPEVSKERFTDVMLGSLFPPIEQGKALRSGIRVIEETLGFHRGPKSRYSPVLLFSAGIDSGNGSTGNGLCNIDCAT